MQIPTKNEKQVGFSLNFSSLSYALCVFVLGFEEGVIKPADTLVAPTLEPHEWDWLRDKLNERKKRNVDETNFQQKRLRTKLVGDVEVVVQSKSPGIYQLTPLKLLELSKGIINHCFCIFQQIRITRRVYQIRNGLSH